MKESIDIKSPGFAGRQHSSGNLFNTRSHEHFGSANICRSNWSANDKKNPMLRLGTHCSCKLPILQPHRFQVTHWSSRIPSGRAEAGKKEKLPSFSAGICSSFILRYLDMELHLAYLEWPPLNVDDFFVGRYDELFFTLRRVQEERVEIAADFSCWPYKIWPFSNDMFQPMTTYLYVVQHFQN